MAYNQPAASPSASSASSPVLLPTEAPWRADYLAELTVFPAGRYDDQVDSTAQFLAWARKRLPGQGIIDYWAGR